MPRNPNTTLEKIAHYLSAVGKPVTIAQIDSAGIATKATCYRLLIDREAKAKQKVDVPIQAKIHGIYSVGNHYPAHYMYADPAEQDIAVTHAHLAEKRTELHRVAEKLSDAVSNVPILDSLEKNLLSAFQNHRETYGNDTSLENNFKQPAMPIEQYYETLNAFKEIAIADPVKFRTLLLSIFMSSFNGEEQ